MSEAFTYAGLPRSAVSSAWQFVYDPTNKTGLLEPPPRDYGGTHKLAPLTAFGNAAFASQSVLLGTAVHELQHIYDLDQERGGVIYQHAYDVVPSERFEEAVDAIQEFRAWAAEVIFISRRGGYSADEMQFALQKFQEWQAKVGELMSTETALELAPILGRR